MVEWEKPTATDNSGNVSDVVCDPPSGYNFPIGQTTVTCNAVDGVGNKAACHFQLNVSGIMYCSLAKNQKITNA